jgi:hypothetical protein
MSSTDLINNNTGSTTTISDYSSSSALLVSLVNFEVVFHGVLGQKSILGSGT